MATRILLTGTGTPIPSARRAGPGVLVEVDGKRLQFDAGRGTTMRLAAAGVHGPMIDAVFLTHHHSDHLVGLADLVFSRWVGLADNPPLPIHCPAGPTARFVESLLDQWTEDIEVRQVHTGRSSRPSYQTASFDPGSRSPVWIDADVEVAPGEVSHEPVVPAVGYRVRTPGGDVVISGDTRVSPAVASLVAGAAVVVHEACRSSLLADGPRRVISDYHADTVQLGRMCDEQGVGTLILTHLIPEPLNPDQARLFESDIREGGFTGEVVVGEDLYEHHL